jgi:hypothetical protein
MERSSLFKLNGVHVERPQRMLMRVSAVVIHEEDIGTDIEICHLISRKVSFTSERDAKAATQKLALLQGRVDELTGAACRDLLILLMPSRRPTYRPRWSAPAHAYARVVGDPQGGHRGRHRNVKELVLPAHHEGRPRLGHLGDAGVVR